MPDRAAEEEDCREQGGTRDEEVEDREVRIVEVEVFSRKCSNIGLVRAEGCGRQGARSRV